MSLLDDIRKDRDAGPKVDWELEKEGGSWGRASGTIHGYIFMSCIMDDHDGADEVNARRIARVPQLETALLAADELAKAAEKMGDGAHHHAVKSSSLPDPQVMLDEPVFDAVFAALAAYRTAIGDV